MRRSSRVSPGRARNCRVEQCHVARIQLERFANCHRAATFSRSSTMNTGARPSPVASSLVSSLLSERTVGVCRHSVDVEPGTGAPGEASAGCEERVRVYVAADNRLLREALAKLIARRGNVEVMGSNSPVAFDSRMLVS